MKGETIMKKYRIGELAKKMCVSLDYIRFYEEKGLIESWIDPDNNYHYYDISQAEIIYLIQLYRKLGYSVKETVDVMKNRSREEILKMHTSLISAHKEAIRNSSYNIRYLEFLKTVLSTEDGTWYISREPSFWFLAQTENDDFLEDMSFDSMYHEWAEYLPPLISMDQWKLNADRTLHSIRHGRAIGCSVAENFGLHPGPPAELYPAKRCLEYYYDSVNFHVGSDLGLDNIRVALNVVKEKEFTIDGDIFLRHVMSYRENGNQHDRFIIYIPIV